MEPKKFLIKKSASGLGLYSNIEIKKGEFVIEYTGNMISNDEADKKGGKYLFQVNSKCTVDGTDRKNISRYINHSCRPNCEAYIKGKKIKIYSKRKISIGEELTYDYGKEYFDEYIKSHRCTCNHCKKRSAGIR
jgi:hypothetical protein